jgi:hypothetical protein
VTAGICYYSDGRPDAAILESSHRTIAAAGLPIIAVTLKPIDWPVTRIVLPLMRGIQTMFRQMLAGLEALDTDVAFFAEHDVLYSPFHWQGRPPNDTTYLYNQNRWQVDIATGRAVHYLCNQTSGLCANRELLIQHYQKRIAWVDQHGFSRANGFEAGTRNTSRGGFDDYPHAAWMSETPNIDLRHAHNLTASRWSPDEFRDRQYCQGWTEAADVPGWGRAADIVAGVSA